MMNPETTVVGIDTAGNRLHWVATRAIGPGQERYGWIKCDNKNADDRRSMICEYAKGLFGCLPRNTHVFIEEPLALQNGKTTRILCMVGGAVWAMFNEYGNGFLHWVDVAHWKKEVVGKGNASKSEIADYVRYSDEKWLTFEDAVSRSDFDSEIDLYDAFCLMRYGMGVDLESA